MASPPLTSVQVQQLSTAVAQYIASQREAFLPSALPLAEQQRHTMEGFFLPEVIHGTRLVVLQNGRVQNPSFYPQLLQMGLRVSEVAALRIADVALRERAGSVKVQGKGGKQREISLNTSARRGLSAYLETRQSLRAHDPLITSESGAALAARSIQSVVSELARRAKITRLPVTAHSLRHTLL